MTSSTTSNEIMYIDNFSSSSALVVIQPRLNRLKYSIDHQGENFIILENGFGHFANMRLVYTPISNTRRENWCQLIPYNFNQELLHFIAFKNYIAVYIRRDTLVGLTILKTEIKNSIGTVIYVTESKWVQFDEPLGMINPNRDYHNYTTSFIRFSFESFLIPKQEWEYDMLSHSRRLLKEERIPSGYNKSHYIEERIYSPIRAVSIVNSSFNTPIFDVIPISIIYKTATFKQDGSNPALSATSIFFNNQVKIYQR